MTINVYTAWEAKTCPSKGCHVHYALTEDHVNRLRNTGESFYCPNGHSLSFPKAASDAYKLQQAEARETALQDQLSAAIRDAEQTRTALIRDRYRFSKGVCPCCNRSFEALRRHMATKHPDYDITQVKQASSRDFKCSCGRTFETPRGLAVHQGHMRPHNWDAPNASRWSAHLTQV